MKDYKISVIIPVYGVEKYIKQCLDSVINQTYKNLEIIIVNDGTKDNSMKIVEEYLLDERIKVINKENGGLSSARNFGLKNATGDYISFVDSDDWIELSLYEKLVENLNNEDIIIFNFIKFNERINITSVAEINIEKIRNFNKGYLFYKNSHYSCWNKLYSKKYLEKINAQFIEGMIYEDVYWGMITLYQTNKVKFLNILGYYYRENRIGSIMNTVDEVLDNITNQKIARNIEIFLKNTSLESTAIILGSLELENWKNKNRDIKDLANLDNAIKKFYSKNLSDDEKKYIYDEFQDFIKDKKIKKIVGLDLLSIFYLKNKFLNFKLFRRELKRRLNLLK